MSSRSRLSIRDRSRLRRAQAQLSHGPTPAAVAPEFVALHLLPEPARPSVELVVAGVTVRADAGTDVDWLASLALALHRCATPC